MCAEFRRAGPGPEGHQGAGRRAARRQGQDAGPIRWALGPKARSNTKSKFSRVVITLPFLCLRSKHASVHACSERTAPVPRLRAPAGPRVRDRRGSRRAPASLSGSLLSLAQLMGVCAQPRLNWHTCGPENTPPHTRARRQPPPTRASSRRGVRPDQGSGPRLVSHHLRA